MTTYCSEWRPDVSSKMQRVGPFLLGPIMGNTPPVQCLKQHLARRELTRDFCTIKVLSLPQRDLSEPEPLQEQQGRILLSTEHKVLTRLKGHPGIVQHRGYFKEVQTERIQVPGNVTKVRPVTKMCLVLDSQATPHDFEGSTNRLTNLQYYVLKNKKLPEREAVSIFVNVVQIVERLHRENIVHRDLKLGNFTLNLETKEVILGNFGLAKELEGELQLLIDQRGSPAYISPEVISGKAYLGKPSDMWALGVTLYTMLFGTFPFYDKEAPELFKKIKSGEFKIPGDAVIGSTCVNLIESLLVLDPSKRLTAPELLTKLKLYIAMRYSSTTTEICNDLQVVPSLSRKRSHDDEREPSGEPSIKRSKVVRVTDQDMFDLEEVLVATSSQQEKREGENVESQGGSAGSLLGDEGLQEPPKKLKRYAFTSTSGLRSIKITKVKDEPRVLTAVDMEKLYALYTAHRSKVGGTSSSSAVPPTVVHQTGTVDLQTISVVGPSPAAGANSINVNKRLLRSPQQGLAQSPGVSVS